MTAGHYVYIVLFVGGFLAWQLVLKHRVADWKQSREAPPGRQRDEEAHTLLSGAARSALAALERDDVGPIAGLLTGMREGQWDERATLLRVVGPTLTRPPLDAAIAANPNDATLYLLRGQQGVEWAWKARGHGAGSSVGDEGWRRFHERMTMAERDFLRAAELDPSAPTPYGPLVEVCQHLDQGEEAAQRWLSEALRRDPTDFAARRSYFTFFCALRWHGSMEKMRAVAQDAAAAAPVGSPNHSLVLSMHREAWSYERHFGDPAKGDAYAARPDVRAEVAESFARSVGAPGHQVGLRSKYLLNDFAMWFFVVQDRERCAAALSKLTEDEYTETWAELGPRGKQFAIARAWALKGGPHRILGWK